MTSATQFGVTGRSEVFQLLREQSTRLVSIYGCLDSLGKVWVHYIMDIGNREYRMLKLPADEAIASATAITPAAAWYERELHDQFGIQIEGHPDLRPLVFHQNWPDGVHPMRSEPSDVPWVQRDYSFLKVDGVGVCEVAVGPVHAGIIEPGHFRFSVVGDTILHLELRHFYTHKGTERLFEGTHFKNGAIIAESVSGDNCFSHGVAYCQAVEHGCDVAAPPQAQAIRLVGQELERIMAHIADVGALCGDIGFSVPAAYTARLKERLLLQSANILGTRYWRSISVPGGVTRDIPPHEALRLRGTIKDVAREFAELAQMVLDTPSVQDRFESTGSLKTSVARDLAVVGPVARASGLHIDVRLDHPYGAYRGWVSNPVTYHFGDVLARARVRIDETAASVLLLDEALQNLPTGPISADIDELVDSSGFSAVESPRGELLYWVEIRSGKIARCHIKSPSFQNWPALPLTMPGNIIADFPLINKSFNLSYSGCDR